MLALGKAEHVEVNIVETEAMTTWAKRQASAEVAMQLVVRAHALIGRQRHLVRPSAIDG
jgi:hypothetical protein